MALHNIILELALIYFGASILATLFLYLKQPIILSYIVLGMLIGPYGVIFLVQAEHVEQISHFGIILLLFLIGLNMHPDKLYSLFRKVFFITLTSSFFFAATISLLVYSFSFPLFDCILTGLALMFSSTVISLKLIPTSDLHHNRIGEIMLSVLLLQDILAIILLLFVGGENTDISINIFIPLLLLKTLALILIAFFCAKYLILHLFEKFCQIQEYIFVISLGWCLFIAEVSVQLGLSYEIGAFIAGVSIAISPIALVIAEKLKPLREFFLILFFFAIGAQFNLGASIPVLFPAITIAIAVIILKPLCFYFIFQRSGEKKETAKELSLRLGQGSEFSLLVAYTAYLQQNILQETSYLIQLTVLITFIVSTYVVVYNYATPISSSSENRRD